MDLYLGPFPFTCSTSPINSSSMSKAWGSKEGLAIASHITTESVTLVGEKVFQEGALPLGSALKVKGNDSIIMIITDKGSNLFQGPAQHGTGFEMSTSLEESLISRILKSPCLIKVPYDLELGSEATSLGALLSPTIGVLEKP